MDSADEYGMHWRWQRVGFLRKNVLMKSKSFVFRLRVWKVEDKLENHMRVEIFQFSTRNDEAIFVSSLRGCVYETDELYAKSIKFEERGEIVQLVGEY